jgi:hypothetical protein
VAVLTPLLQDALRQLLKKGVVEDKEGALPWIATYLKEHNPNK